jgi:tetratricopeptide (TPR) repeat protein
MSSAPAQTDSDVRDMIHQIDQLRDAGKFQEAVPIAEKVLKYCERNDGPDHPETADSLNDLASLYAGMGNYAKAVPLYERALKIREKALGKDHPYTAVILNNLAEAYRQNGDYAKAEPLYKRAIKIFEDKL